MATISREAEIASLRGELQQLEMSLLMLPRLIEDIAPTTRLPLRKIVKPGVTNTCKQLVRTARKLVELGSPVHIDAAMYHPIIKNILEQEVKRQNMLSGRRRPVPAKAVAKPKPWEKSRRGRR